MLGTALVAVAGVAAIGLGFKAYTHYAQPRDYYGSTKHITWLEYTIALVAVSLVILPLVMWIGSSLSVDSQLQRNQFFNGVEQQAIELPLVYCKAGHSGDDDSAGESNCVDTYVSGSYTWTTWTTDCDSNGKNCHETPHTHWADIHTPYATVEHRYEITNSLTDPFVFPDVYLDANPVRYKSDKAIPGDYLRGAPSDWLDAKAHIAAGNPRPVTNVQSYQDPILATDSVAYKAWSGTIDQDLKAKILPDPVSNVTHPLYGPAGLQADKVSFVGINIPNEKGWQSGLMQLNGGLGMKLQGDMHVVIANCYMVTDPVGYTTTVKAYWQSSKYFGKNTIAKNAIIVVLGTCDGQTVAWAQATTGMPYGNEVMLQAIHDQLTGTNVKLDPKTILGDLHTVVTPPAKKGDKKTITVTPSYPRGVIDNIVFTQFPFARACEITCPPGQVGYKDLIAKIQPGPLARTLMIVIICFVSLFFWLFVLQTSFMEDWSQKIKSFFGGDDNDKKQDKYNRSTNVTDGDNDIADLLRRDRTTNRNRSYWS